MTPYFEYGVLRSDDSDEARLANDQLLGKNTLGIEVTDPVLAARCGLGNIDPQHTEGGMGKSSAIEMALTFSLPDEGTRLVTVRPDKDAFGAMAILTLRARKMDRKIDLYLVSWMGAMDSMGFHNARDKYPELYAAVGDSRDTIDAIQTITRNPELGLPVEERVELIARIITDEMSDKEISHYALMKRRVRLDFEIEKWGPWVAFVTAPGQYHAARDWINRLHPVAVVFDPEYRDETQTRDRDDPYPRWTVIRQPGVFDRKGFEQDINKAEARKRGISVEQLAQMSCRWGGPRNIVVSAKGQGHETRLSKAEILGIVQKHAKSGIVS